MSRYELNNADLHFFLEEKFNKYNTLDFIENDPISIPHLFSNALDIEIMAFFASTLAWGQRVTIIKKCKELIQLMEKSPYQFITQHQESDLKLFLNFKHRTFNPTDALYFIHFLKHHYQKYRSLEDAFLTDKTASNVTAESSLNHFQEYFFSLPEFPARTKKHISSPKSKSACKRLNMFLRWMVRKDNKGVDFGIWKRISPAQLICPCDLHVDRVARKLGLITRKQTDWLTALELTESLRVFDPIDPVKYDFALFGYGVEEGKSNILKM